MTLASVASDAAFAWLSIRSCPGSAVETNGTANDSSSSDSSSCGQYPILLFVATAVVGAVSYRQSSFSPSRSRGPLNHALAFVVVYLLFAFCGSIAANLFLGRAPASLVPREEYRFAYAVVWAVFGVFLSDRSIRSFDERLGLSGFLKFLAALDAATTSFNVVHAAHAKGLPFLACLFAGCLVGCAGYFVRELAVVPSGNLNLASKCFFPPWVVVHARSSPAACGCVDGLVCAS